MFVVACRILPVLENLPTPVAPIQYRTFTPSPTERTAFSHPFLSTAFASLHFSRMILRSASQDDASDSFNSFQTSSYFFVVDKKKLPQCHSRSTHAKALTPTDIHRPCYPEPCLFALVFWRTCSSTRRYRIN